MPDEVALTRIREITLWGSIDGPVRPVVELIIRTASRLTDPRVHQALSYIGYANKEGVDQWEAELAHLLELELPATLLAALVRAAVTNGTQRVDPRRRKRLLPLFREAADKVRAQASARHRLEEVEKALELPGALLSSKPVKAPKLAPSVALKHGAGTEGGPSIAIPAEVVESWRGTLLANGTPAEGDFSATDYGRACDVDTWQCPWGPWGLLSVGNLMALVLGQAVSYAKLKDGTCRLAMQGEGEEVAALLASDRPWSKLEGSLELPSGELVLFDSAFERAKSHKTRIKLAPGKFALEVYVQDDAEAHLWVVRLRPTT